MRFIKHRLIEVYNQIKNFRKTVREYSIYLGVEKNKLIFLPKNEYGYSGTPTSIPLSEMDKIMEEECSDKRLIEAYNWIKDSSKGRRGISMFNYENESIIFNLKNEYGITGKPISIPTSEIEKIIEEEYSK